LPDAVARALADNNAYDDEDDEEDGTGGSTSKCSSTGSKRKGDELDGPKRARRGRAGGTAAGGINEDKKEGKKGNTTIDLTTNPAVSTFKALATAVVDAGKARIGRELGKLVPLEVAAMGVAPRSLAVSLMLARNASVAEAYMSAELKGIEHHHGRQGLHRVRRAMG
jgi:hypothetical protein